MCRLKQYSGMELALSVHPRCRMDSLHDHYQETGDETGIEINILSLHAILRPYSVFGIFSLVHLCRPVCHRCLQDQEPLVMKSMHMQAHKQPYQYVLRLVLMKWQT